MGTFEFLQLLFAFAAANILCGLVIYALFIIIEMIDTFFWSIYDKYVNYKRNKNKEKRRP